MSSSTDSSPTPSRQPMQTISEASRPSRPKTGTPIEEIIGKKKTVTVADRLAGLSANERIGLQVGGRNAKTTLAIGDITEALTKSDPISKASSALGMVSKVNLENQRKQLMEGGTPVFDTDTGKTVGVVNKAGQYSGDANFQQAALKAGKGDSIELSGTNVLEEARLESKESESQSTAQSVAAEEEKKKTLLSGVTQEGRGRGTRGKRFGGAGTILEGTGALYD